MSVGVPAGLLLFFGASLARFSFFFLVVVREMSAVFGFPPLPFLAALFLCVVE